MTRNAAALAVEVAGGEAIRGDRPKYYQGVADTMGAVAATVDSADSDGSEGVALHDDERAFLAHLAQVVVQQLMDSNADRHRT